MHCTINYEQGVDSNCYVQSCVYKFLLLGGIGGGDNKSAVSSHSEAGRSLIAIKSCGLGGSLGPLVSTT